MGFVLWESLSKKTLDDIGFFNSASFPFLLDLIKYWWSFQIFIWKSTGFFKCLKKVYGGIFTFDFAGQRDCALGVNLH